MPTLLQDLRFALRQLRRKPGFTLGVILVLALGMGAGAAMFSVLRGTLLQPLPYRDPGQLVFLQAHADDGRTTSSNLADIEIWQSRTHTLSSIAYSTDNSGFLRIGGLDQQIDTPSVSSNLFATLGVAPALGRGFTQQEQAANAPIIVLDHTLWQSLFHGDPGALGKTVSLDGKVRTVVGVMPGGFSFPANPTHPQAWLPAAADAPAHTRDFTTRGFGAFARRNPAYTNAAVSGEITAIQKPLRSLYKGELADALAPHTVDATDIRQTLDKKARPALDALSAAVAVLWLIACASAAGLLLARGAARAQEFALRGALGASRTRLLRQVLTESLVLALAAALCGLVFAIALLAVSSRVLQRQLHHGVAHVVSFPVLAAMAALVLATATLFGTLPAWLASRGSLDSNLREGARTGTGRAHIRLQQLLIVGELALTVTLLVSCGLLLRTVFSLRKVPLGFRTDHILVAELQLPAFRYANQDLLRTVYQPLLTKAEHLPGVETASLSTVMPLSGDFDMTYGTFVSNSKGGKPEESWLKLRMVTPPLQKVLGFHMLKGRYFNASDTLHSQPVAVVNKAFADRYDRAGKQWAAGNFTTFGDQRVIGIMENFHQISMADAAVPEIQISANQLTPASEVPFTGIYQSLMQAHVELALRTRMNPLALRTELESLLRSTDSALASSTLRSMDQIVDDSIGSQLVASRLLLGFAGLALLVALAGLYSLLSFSVTTRTRELGVRLALGAKRSDVLLLVLRSAGILLAAGSVLGIAMSAASVRLLGSFLFGVKSSDLSTTAFAVALLLLCGSFAALLPARRAAATDPMEALRTE